MPSNEPKFSGYINILTNDLKVVEGKRGTIWDILDLESILIILSFEKILKIMKEVTVTIIGEGYAYIAKKATPKLTSPDIAGDYKTIFDMQADGYVEEESYPFELFRPIGLKVLVEVDGEVQDVSSRFRISNDAAWLNGAFKLEECISKPFVLNEFAVGTMEVTYKFEISDRAKFNAKKLKLMSADRYLLGNVAAHCIVYDGKVVESVYDINVEYDREKSRLIRHGLS